MGSRNSAARHTEHKLFLFLIQKMPPVKFCSIVQLKWQPYMASSEVSYKIKGEGDRLLATAKAFDKAKNFKFARKNYLLALYKYDEVLKSNQTSDALKFQMTQIIDAVLARVNVLQQVFNQGPIDMESLRAQSSRLGTRPSAAQILPKNDAPVSCQGDPHGANPVVEPHQTEVPKTYYQTHADLIPPMPPEEEELRRKQEEEQRIQAEELRRKQEEEQRMQAEAEEQRRKMESEELWRKQEDEVLRRQRDEDEQRQQYEMVTHYTEVHRKANEEPRESPHKKEAVLSDQIVPIENYSIIKKLGNGTFGNVSLARNNETGEFVAMKILDTELSSFQEQVSFLREVESLARVDHPALLKFKGFSLRCSETDLSPAILTEYLPNGSLEDVVTHKKKLTPTEKMIALYGTAEGMRYMHEELSMVHRDLKPANVMLNKFKEPVIGDFGLSKIMSHQQMRQSGTMGTPVYMAPELMSGTTYTNKVDVYAYAVMMYELMTEKLAFEEDDAPTLMNKVIRGIRPPLPDDMHPGYRELITRAWDQDPDMRPSFTMICQAFQEGRMALIDSNMQAFSAYVQKMT